MENLTHSLFGATLAELVLPAGATPAQRRLFFTVGIVAANLPDADLLYSSFIPAPLGYLLHHRGYTHTFVGLVAQGALIGVVLLLPRLRAMFSGAAKQLWMLIALALLSHVALDSWNVYGVHPFWPIDNAWYYGDAISIFEPWLWILLGLSVAANTRSDRGRRALFALSIVLVALTGAIGLVQPASAALLLAVAALMWRIGRRMEPRRRAFAALAGAAVFVVASMLLSRTARAHVSAETSVSEQHTLDIAVSPHPAQPLCWSTWVIQRSVVGDAYSVSRGNVSLAPRSLASLGCSTQQRFVEGPHSVRQLGDIVQHDCWARAWMQFARFPWVVGGQLVDARFDEPGRPSFTALPFVNGRGCPSHLTNWEMPRGDLVMSGVR